MFNKLHEYFVLLVGLHTIFKALPQATYAHYTELDISLMEMKIFQYPMGKYWKAITKYLALRQHTRTLALKELRN